jgi:hypothetical protein
MSDEVFEKVKKETEIETPSKPEINVPVINQTSSNNTNNSNKKGRLSHR